MGWLARYLEVGGDTDTYRTGLSPDQTRHATERSLFSVRYDSTEVQLVKSVHRERSSGLPALHISDSASTISLDDVRTLAFRPNSLPTSQHPSVVSARVQKRSSSANVPGATRERDGSVHDEDCMDAIDFLREPSERYRHRKSLSRSSSVGVRSLHEEPVAEYQYDAFQPGKEEGTEEVKDLQFEMEGEGGQVSAQVTSTEDRGVETHADEGAGMGVETKESEADDTVFAVQSAAEPAVKKSTPPVKKPDPFNEPVSNAPAPGPFGEAPATTHQSEDRHVFREEVTTSCMFNPFKAKQEKKALQRQRLIEQQLALQGAGLLDTSLDIAGVQQDLWRQRRQRKMYGVMEELDEELRDAALGGPSPTQPIMIAPVQRWV